VAWLSVIQGRKHWFLMDPNNDWPGMQPHCEYDVDKNDHTPGILQCVQEPHEIIFIPEAWWHATCNLDAWTVCIGAQSYVRGMTGSGNDLLEAVRNGDVKHARTHALTRAHT
jgi:ribosomal protein L16 Arg81 hydroxylase